MGKTWGDGEMKNLKILPPTLRDKRRYISFKVIPESGEEFTYADLESAVWDALLDFLGEYGVSKTNAWLMKDCWDSRKKAGIIRCNHKSVQAVIVCLGLIDRLGDNRICFKILKVSGTLKGLTKK